MKPNIDFEIGITYSWMRNETKFAECLYGIHQKWTNKRNENKQDFLFYDSESFASPPNRIETSK